jgi:hypothetical protein
MVKISRACRPSKMATAACLAACMFVAAATRGEAQESKSGAAAKALVAALEGAQLDSIAAKDPTGADVYVGALYIKGFQLLVVSGAYAAPAYMDGRLSRKEYRDAYIDLNGATAAESRMLIEDLGADGLRADREDNQPFDSVDTGGKRTMFDGDWKKQRLTEDEYMKVFAATDARYADILNALLGQVKRGT